MVNTAKFSRAYSEVYSFMNALGSNYINKIPASVYNSIKDNRDIDYKPQFDKDQNITDGMISKEGLALIAALNLQYWCDDETEKKELKQIYIDNAKQEKEKYSYDNIFNNNNNETIRTSNEEENKIEESTSLIEYKESIFRKLINRIKDFFHLVR